MPAGPPSEPQRPRDARSGKRGHNTCHDADEEHGALGASPSPAQVQHGECENRSRAESQK